MNWVALALLSAFFLATADALTKRYLSEARASEMALIRFGISGFLLLPLLLMQPWPALDLRFWGWVLMLIPLEIGAMLLYMRAITESPLTLTLPYLAFTPAFNTITGYLILGETVSLIGLLGILLIVAGAWLLNLEAGKNGVRPDLIAPFRAIFRQKGSRLMLLVAAIYSVTSVMGKAAMQPPVEPAFFGPFYFVVLGSATSLLFLFHDKSAFRVAARHPWAGLSIGLMMAGMVVSHFYALENAEVAYMIAVKRMSLLFGIVYGAIWFGEQGLTKNLFAGLLMVAGVYLIV